MTVRVELDDAGERIQVFAEWRYKELCKSIPGSSWKVKNGYWTIPVSWSGCLALRSTFRNELEIGPKLTEWALNEHATRVAPSNALRLMTEIEGGFQDLYPHQRAGVEFLATARRALLADEPGLGKTAQAIRALTALQMRGKDVFPAMVVCPNTIKKNWEREFALWWPGVNVQVISGTATKRRKQFEAFLHPTAENPSPHVLVINWESLRSHSRLAPYGSIALARCPECGGVDEKITPLRCEVHQRELNMIDFKSVIADEIHRSKSPQSKQTRALWAATGNAETRFALTGTPIANDVIDLWSILHWLSPEEWPTKSRWIDRMVDTMLNAFGGTIVLGVKPEMTGEFYASINPRMRRMLKAVVLPNLPKIVYDRRSVEMHPKQAKAYKQMLDHMITELEDGSVMTAPSRMTKSLRLAQFSSSYAELQTVEVVDPETGEIKQKVKTILSEPSSTLDALMTDIKAGDFGDDSVVISAVSRQLLDLLAIRFDKEKIPFGMITGGQTEDERQRAMDDFQAGKIKWVLINQAGGVGITLTAARRLIRLQRPWSLIDDKQLNDRVHRIGSEIHDSIIITDYIVDGTVQERVREVLDEKGGNFEEIVQDEVQLLEMLKREKEGH